MVIFEWNLQDAIQYFHSFVPDVSEQLCRQHPSKLVCAVSPSITDHSVGKRLITCVLAALRANGMHNFFFLTKQNKIDDKKFDFDEKSCWT